LTWRRFWRETPPKQLRSSSAADILPAWLGAYSSLGGLLSIQTGQIAKAREVLERFKNSIAGYMDINRIEQVLAQAPERSPAGNEPMSMAGRNQLLQLAAPRG
jgi:hypothetical protein